jgi:hypothetical protein
VWDGSIQSNMREKFWIKCAGVQRYKQNYCRDYYKCLCEMDALKAKLCEPPFPNKHFQQVDKDLQRTFPDDPFFTDDVRQSLRRVFRAYIWRNPAVGYYQGVNFLIYRIRKVLSEEDTFWMFCLIVESYLPPDFYVDMYGATTHATMLIRIFEQYGFIPNVMNKFNELQYPIVNLSC